MRRTLFALPFLLAVAAYVLLPLPGTSAPLSDRIEKKRGQVEAKKQREGVLSTTIQRYNTNISSLQGEINTTETRLTQVQSELDAARG
jgi:septal ring factor EnvC (AmiA/AmiB activator)